MSKPGSSYFRIYDVVRQIPEGLVATYGDIAELASFQSQARLVGYALHALPKDTSVPWHRVVNAKGEVSTRSTHSGSEFEQRFRLETEGVAFNAKGRIPLEHFRWNPEGRSH